MKPGSPQNFRDSMPLYAYHVCGSEQPPGFADQCSENAAILVRRFIEMTKLYQTYSILVTGTTRPEGRGMRLPKLKITATRNAEHMGTCIARDIHEPREKVWRPYHP